MSRKRKKLDAAFTKLGYDHKKLDARMRKIKKSVDEMNRIFGEMEKKK
ncbi:MAG TPA: hypothetical protein IAA44_02960 [Candidatus Blautia avistercoris]|nr:hypothetical protein [Blautia sp. An249]HIY18341.1 hypothetical protein [Candidatus Blautia avistercoris]